MKKTIRNIILSSLLVTAIGLAPVFCHESFKETRADETTNYPRNGQSGNILYVNGNSTYFNTGEADLAIYCFNSESDNAWSDRVSYRCFSDLLRVMIPYQNGNSKTWAYYIVCRYDPNKDPSVDGFGGVYNQTDNISFGNMIQAQNVVNITGYSNSKMTYQLTTANYYGIKGFTHAYLDLSGYTGWETGDAKFALYFACPSQTNESRWGQYYDGSSYHSGFCWKVEGQDNDHLYECIVPSIYSENNPNLWNLVIAVRFDPVATEPGWNNVWNQTQNLSFNSSNHTANMIHINAWNEGQLDTTNSISKATRLEFYGRYFLDTVVCSGNGNSDATTSAMWNAVKNEYIYHLSHLYQGDIWTTTADEEGSLIEQAMARYDYIVLYKEYNHEDFINRAGSPNKTTYSNSNVLLNDNNQTTIIIAIVLTLSFVGLSVLIALKVRKLKRNKSEY